MGRTGLAGSATPARALLPAACELRARAKRRAPSRAGSAVPAAYKGTRTELGDGCACPFWEALGSSRQGRPLLLLLLQACTRRAPTATAGSGTWTRCMARVRAAAGCGWRRWCCWCQEKAAAGCDARCMHRPRPVPNHWGPAGRRPALTAAATLLGPPWHRPLQAGLCSRAAPGTRAAGSSASTTGRAATAGPMAAATG